MITTMAAIMDAKKVDLLTYAKNHTKLKWVAGTGGGEYAGACPMCGGTDRFRVQPNHNLGRWLCRGCSPEWNDVIELEKRLKNCDFNQAVKNLTGGELFPASPKEPETVFNHIAWANQGMKFINECADLLFTAKGKAGLDWLQRRGIQPETAQKWKLGYNPFPRHYFANLWGMEGRKVYIPTGIVIPNLSSQGLKYIKVRQFNADPKYLMLRGSQSWLYGSDTMRNASSAILQESELDAILAHQELPGIGSLALPAGMKIKAEFANQFAGILGVIVAYDNDEPGQKAADELLKIAGFYKAEPFPFGKDLSEYNQKGGNVLDWLLSQLDRLPGE